MKKSSVPPKPLTAAAVHAFRRRIYRHYALHGRDLPWRKNPSPYRVLISEVMLQQTQVERVTEKYKEFLAAFPDFRTLAGASPANLLRGWSGMGYNRRALALRDCAQKIMNDHRGRLPADPELLVRLPGIGKYTAGAILAFAFNKPILFMDTNIRRVYLHEFFRDGNGVTDDQIAPFLQQTMDRIHPRKWFNALMDYGTMLKKRHPNPNRRSAHYSKQTPFANSNRHVRGVVLKLLIGERSATEAQLVKKTGFPREHLVTALEQLRKEGFIRKQAGRFAL